MRIPQPYFIRARLQYEADKKRFMSKVEVTEDGCWMWMGCRHQKGGYGTACWLGTPSPAHRVSYFLFKEDLPPDLDVDHICVNPWCVNPDHLEAVTRSENGRRRWQRQGRRTHCLSGHEFTDENTYISPRGARFCRTCSNERHQKYQALKTEALRELGVEKKPPGWNNASKTHCPKGHEYTPENTGRGSSGGRTCLACKMARYYQNHEAEKEKMRERARLRRARPKET